MNPFLLDNPAFVRNRYHLSSNLLLILILLAPIAAEARPSFRSVRENAFKPKEARIEQYKAPVAIKYERYAHHKDGFTTEIPKDWEWHIIDGNEPLAKLSSDLTLFWSNQENMHGELSIGVISKNARKKERDLQAQFDTYLRQPNGLFLATGDLYIREYKQLDIRSITVQGISSEQETYSFILQSTNWRVREVRVPTAFGTVVLRYRNAKEHFDRELFVFDHFVESLSIPATQKNAGTSSIAPKRRIAPAASSTARTAAERARERRLQRE